MPREMIPTGHDLKNRQYMFEGCAGVKGAERPLAERAGPWTPVSSQNLFFYFSLAAASGTRDVAPALVGIAHEFR